MDYKYWIQCKADEIADDTYGKYFHNLDKKLQEEVYKQATQSYVDYYSGMLDRNYETIRDGLMFKEEKDG